MAFLQFLLLIFFFGLLAVVAFAWRFFGHVRSVMKQFAQTAQQGQQRDTVTDNRPESERRKKIIPHDEGEYVDFKEVD